MGRDLKTVNYNAQHKLLTQLVPGRGHTLDGGWTQCKSWLGLSLNQSFIFDEILTLGIRLVMEVRYTALCCRHGSGEWKQN